MRPALALIAALSLAACQNPDGSTDYLRSVAGGAAAGAGAGLFGGLVNDVANSQRQPYVRDAPPPGWRRRGW